MDVNALDASQHLEGTAMEVEGPPVETVDTYPALDAEESDTVGADSDVDMGMDSVNDEETDVVVSDSVSRPWVIGKS